MLFICLQYMMHVCMLSFKFVFGLKSKFKAVWFLFSFLSCYNNEYQTKKITKWESNWYEIKNLKPKANLNPDMYICNIQFYLHSCFNHESRQKNILVLNDQTAHFWALIMVVVDYSYHDALKACFTEQTGHITSCTNSVNFFILFDILFACVFFFSTMHHFCLSFHSFYV